jgi:putative nucleotidyltransferase with HDIG domain
VVNRVENVATVISGLDPERLVTLLARMCVHDMDTHVHLLGVAELTLRVSCALGLEDAVVLQVATAALFHDIGKLDISPVILRAPRPLRAPEWDEMRKHPSGGAWMLRQAGEAGLANIVMSHHERLDGSGYPHGLKGDQIPFGSQIISAVDSYDTMLYVRPYKAGRSHDDVISELHQLAGRIYDRAIVDALVSVTTQSEGTHRLHALRT